MRQKNQGFTIVEVLIVLAIAALLLLIVFLAVPTLQRNSRNYERKRTVDLILTQVTQYHSDTGKIPTTDDDGTGFINAYLTEMPAGFEVTFRDNEGAHSDKPAYDDFFVQYGHWCSTHGGADAPGDIIASAPGGDLRNQYFAVYTKLENSRYYCQDNG